MSIPPPTPPPTFPIPATVTVEHDIEFGRVGNRRLLLDLYRPTTPGPGLHPAIVRIHGGGWKTGDKRDTPLVEAAVALVERGFVVISMNYRMVDEAPFPAAVHDVKCATRWLRSQAGTYHIDPARIGSTGSSAGSHLALMLGLSQNVPELEGDGGHANFSSHVSVVVSVCGPTDFMNRLTESSAALAFMGGTMAEKPENYRAASPITYARKDSPPTLFIHGEDDETVPFSQSERLYEKLKSLGAPTQLVRVKNGLHSFAKPNPNGKKIDPDFQTVKEMTYQFLVDHLKK